MFDDPRLIELFKNKRVALIGPSSYLVGKNLGKIFDDYDVIVRVNDVFPKFHNKDYGDRTDIVFYTFPSLDVEDFAFKLMANVNIINKIKMFICPTIKADHAWRDKVEDNIKKLNIYNFSYSVVTHEEYFHILDYWKTPPNTMPASILMLLRYGAKEVLFTGGTFYQDVDRNNVDTRVAYHEGYMLRKPSAWNPHIGHDQLKQIGIFKDKLLKEFNGIVKIDSYLKKLLDIDYENILHIGGGDTNV